MKVVTVKCQRSLFSSTEARMMLFYTEDRKVQGQWRVNARWNALFDLHGDRFFASVCWFEEHGDEQPPDLLKKLPEQGW